MPRSKMEEFLGIEIGGTKLQLGVGGGKGPSLQFLKRLDIDRQQGAQGILNQIEAGSIDLIRQHRIDRIGIGFGGPVNPATGRVLKSHQVTGWDDFDLVGWCLEKLGGKAVLGNDCNCATLAEARFGAGRGFGRVFYLTVGTGVGGGFAVDGEVQGTDRPASAEIGHLRPGLQANHPDDTVESIASGLGMVVRARSLMANQDHSFPDFAPRPKGEEPLGNSPWLQRTPLTARHIGEAAAAGDPLARRVMKDACNTLGWAIAQTITLLSPEVVIIGGGVSLIGKENFMDPVKGAVDRYVFPPLAGSFDLVASELGEEVVVHGAIAMAAEADESICQK